MANDLYLCITPQASGIGPASTCQKCFVNEPGGAFTQRHSHVQKELSETDICHSALASALQSHCDCKAAFRDIWDLFSKEAAPANLQGMLVARVLVREKDRSLVASEVRSSVILGKVKSRVSV